MEKLRKNVMEILINMQYEGYELQDVIIDVLNHGCASGIVGALTYYYQTKEFFINNMEDIFELYNEYKFIYGEINFDLDFNSLSWFAFEEITRMLADELELDY